MITVDKVNEITDSLEHMANAKLQNDIAYHNGYIQACEDFGRKIRALLYKQDEED